MKLRNLIPSIVLLVAQIPIGWAMAVSVVSARSVWAEVLEGAVLPYGTSIAMRFGINIPVTAAIAFVFLFVLAMEGRETILGLSFRGSDLRGPFAGSGWARSHFPRFHSFVACWFMMAMAYPKR